MSSEKGRRQVKLGSQVDTMFTSQISHLALSACGKTVARRHLVPAPFQTGHRPFATALLTYCQLGSEENDLLSHSLLTVVSVFYCLSLC